MGLFTLFFLWRGSHALPPMPMQCWCVCVCTAPSPPIFLMFLVWSRAHGKTGNWKLKRTRKRTAETEIPKQLSRSCSVSIWPRPHADFWLIYTYGIFLPPLDYQKSAWGRGYYIAYYVSMVCVWCTRSHAAGSLWWLSGKFLPRREVAIRGKS